MTNVFIWENFGPMHVDRCEAVAKSGLDVLGLELYGQSDTYDWAPTDCFEFRKITLFNKGRPKGILLLQKLVAFRLKQGRSNWFLCHYEWWEVFVFAAFLRMIGDQVFTMGCSKFDDWPRNSIREALKRIFFKPYQGAIGSGIRSKDFFRFHGFSENKVAVEYNTLSIDRIRKLSGQVPAPSGVNFIDRHFTIIARLVPKKNLSMAVDAYFIYFKNTKHPRILNIFGNGLLEQELREKVNNLDLKDYIIFHGFVQTDGVAKKLATTLALILPSSEEQFGNVVIEAQAMGLPVIISDVCGARDRLVRTGVNGFIFEPDNPEGLAWFMLMLSQDKVLWEKMCFSAHKFASKGDSVMFGKAVHTLLNGAKK